MAQDPFADLREALTEQLQRFWRADTGPGHAPSEVASEILDTYRDPGHMRPLDDDASDSLPLLARLRPRGLFEDDWRARPGVSRPWPVVLIHGTGATKGDWQELGAELRGDGWAVFAAEFGERATSVIEESAAQVGAYVEAVLQVTGADRAILVGHSQGGVLARYWMRMLGGADRVRHLVCLGTPNHGTTMGGIISPVIHTQIAENIMRSIVHSWFGPSGFQQISGHPLIESLNAGGDLEEGVTYTCIATRADTVVQPPETCFLSDEGREGDVQNLWVEDLEPRAVVLHHEMPRDWRVRKIVRLALNAVQLPPTR